MSYKAAEKAILDLADAGLSPRQISKHGFTPTRIHFVLSTFGTKEQYQAEARRHRRNMAAFSDALLAAIQQAQAA